MSIGNWFRRIFFAPARTDAPDTVAAETDDETTIDEARLEAGGGGPMTANYGGVEAGEVVEGELSEYEPPESE